MTGLLSFFCTPPLPTSSCWIFCANNEAFKTAAIAICCSRAYGCWVVVVVDVDDDMLMGRVRKGKEGRLNEPRRSDRRARACVERAVVAGNLVQKSISKQEGGRRDLAPFEERISPNLKSYLATRALSIDGQPSSDVDPGNEQRPSSEDRSIPAG